LEKEEKSNSIIRVHRSFLGEVHLKRGKERDKNLLPSGPKKGSSMKSLHLSLAWIELENSREEKGRRGGKEKERAIHSFDFA